MFQVISTLLCPSLLAIGDIFDVTRQHVEEMGSYSAYAGAVADGMRWFNYNNRETGESIKPVKAWWPIIFPNYVGKRKKSAHKSPLALYEKQLTGANACVLIICAFYTVSTAKILLPKGFKSRQNLFCQDSENKKSPVNNLSWTRNYSQATW